MARKLIINADDFGFSAGINRGIIECFEHELIRSATILVNTPGTAEALDYAARNTELGFGLHLNLIWGRPVSGVRSSLTTGSGEFHSQLGFLARMAAGRIRHEDLVGEIRTQLRCLAASGVAMTHVDSHHHLHVFAPVYRALVEVAPEFGIARVRLPRERLLGASYASWKALFLRASCPGLSRILKARRFAHPDHFLGSALMGGAFTVKRLTSAIRSLAEGTTELMVHPGRPEADFGKIDPYVEWRSKEIDVLANSQTAASIREAGIQIIDYRSLDAAPEPRGSA